MEALQDDVFTTVGLTAGVDTEEKVAAGQGGGPMGGSMETEEQRIGGCEHQRTPASCSRYVNSSGEEVGSSQARTEDPDGRGPVCHAQP